MLCRLAFGTAAAVAFAVSTGLASAADTVPRAAPVVVPKAAVYNWTGIYAGATAGYGWGHSDYLHLTTDWFDFAGRTYTNNVKGLLSGGLIGGNLQAGNFVFGIEGQLLASGVRGGKDYKQYSNSQATILNWLGTITGRVGVGLDDWLFYGKAGYAVGSITAENLYYTAPTHAWSVTNRHGGWTIGVGIDKAVSRHVIVGVEYNYVNLGRVENNSPDSAGTPTNIANNLILHSLMGRVAFKY
jgi:outer membrane immunogenic protein